MALLRCVGATRAQVFRSVLAESAVLGLAGSAAGVAVGYGLAWAVGAALDAAFAGFPFGAVRLSALAVLAPVAVGLAVTVGAALAPARAATRIPPVAALRDQAAPTRRSGRVRLALAAAALAAGCAGMAAGTLVLTDTPAFLAAFFGGAAAFAGVLLAGPVLIPPLLRLAGAGPARLLGTPGRIAAVNAVRNPRRATATTAALLVGVTLMTVMSVGAASLRSTVEAQMAAQFPVDYMVRSQQADIPPGMAEDIAAIPGITDVAVVHGAAARAGGEEVWVSGVDPRELAEVTSQLPELTQVRGGEAVVSQSLSRRTGAGPGDPLRLDGAGAGTAELTVGAVLSGEGAEAAYVTRGDLERHFPDAAVAGVFARAAPDADLVRVGAALDRATAGASVTVTGTAQTEAVYTEVLDTVLLVVNGLLTVAVLIAVVGIANTLALSVIERTRESALLRALGLTRRQLRATLAVEAVLLSTVGAVLGVVLGTVFGWVGLRSMLGASFGVVLDVPAAQLAGLVGGAVLAGLLASVLPARRAARASVVAALADE
ncbi:FtsX-like permease family protein [Streptomonospora sp. S1-112]|uniref:FtsX-like permease family protein n=2 Tax=Streptomonospora mangrovi TaxID=2883123 RepID=A0A9X3NHJ1_9ACTN|nr:FtsX-like permease family protein [Streptomonospora mangrovi]